MNRVQLVQVIVLIVAVMLGYWTIYYFGFFIGHIISYALGAKEETYSHPYLYGISALFFAVFLFLILNNAYNLSLWIIDKVQPDENIQLGFSDRGILYAVMLFVTVTTLLKNVPALLYQLFELFRREAGGGSTSSSPYIDYSSRMNYPQWIKTILTFILLIKLKAVINYFHSKINPEDPHAIETEEDSTPVNP